MKKKDILKTFDLASLVAIVIATILVFFYEFFGVGNLITATLILYASAALSLLIFNILRLLYFVKDIKEDDVCIIDKSIEKKSTLIVKIILSSIIFAFIMVVLIMH